MLSGGARAHGMDGGAASTGQGFSKYAIEKTVALMLKKDDLSHRNQGRHVVRIR